MFLFWLTQLDFVGSGELKNKNSIVKIKTNHGQEIKKYWTNRRKCKNWMVILCSKARFPLDGLTNRRWTCQQNPTLKSAKKRKILRLISLPSGHRLKHYKTSSPFRFRFIQECIFSILSDVDTIFIMTLQRMLVPFAFLVTYVAIISLHFPKHYWNHQSFVGNASDVEFQQAFLKNNKKYHDNQYDDHTTTNISVIIGW